MGVGVGDAVGVGVGVGVGVAVGVGVGLGGGVASTAQTPVTFSGTEAVPQLLPRQAFAQTL